MDNKNNLIKNLIKNFLIDNDTNNFMLKKYISYFWLFWFLLDYKKKKLDKSYLIKFYCRREFFVLNFVHYKYLSNVHLFLNNIYKKYSMYLIVKIFYKMNSGNFKVQNISYGLVKEIFHRYFFKPNYKIYILQNLYHQFNIKNKKIVRYISMIKEISEYIKIAELDKKRKSNMLDEINTINKKHQKLYYSKKHKNLIMYYQKLILELDKYLHCEKNLFCNSDNNFGYLNWYLRYIKYNFSTMSNIYKTQVFETCMFLNNFARLMNQYGFKVTYENINAVTDENTEYIFK